MIHGRDEESTWADITIEYQQQPYITHGKDAESIQGSLMGNVTVTTNTNFAKTNDDNN